MNTINEKIRNIIFEEYEQNFRKIEDSSGNEYLVYTMDAYYDDEISESDVSKILKSDDPEQQFYEILYDAWMDAAFYEEDQVFDLVRKQVSEDEIDNDDLLEIIRETISFEPDYDHYLRQRFCVNILLDTGDGAYDFTLNIIYPHYNGRVEDMDKVCDGASLVWLAKQQGYSMDAFLKEMAYGDIAKPHGFLESCRQELANAPSHMNALVFLVNLSLGELLELHKRMKETPDASLVLNRKVMCGLYDPWSGGGSVLEIELERDVVVPFRYIRSALLDGEDGYYSIRDVYAMCKSAWKEDVVSFMEKEDVV